MSNRLKLWLLLGLAVGLCSGGPARAQEGWSITSFSSDIKVFPDASIEVAERITTRFTGQKHGIFRDIPWQYETEQGTKVSLPITIQEVFRDGKAEPFTESKEGNVVRVKIGDSGTTISGNHSYTIRYKAEAAVNFFDDHDELYWNVTGHDWEVPISDVHATVQLLGTVPAANIMATCFTGTLGATDHDCQTSISDALVTLTATNQATIVVGWPKGFVSHSETYDQVRNQAAASSRPPWTKVWFWVVNGGVVVLGAWWLIRWWRMHGRDPASAKTTVVQYDPPDKLSPAEVGVIIDEQAHTRDVIATMVDLAARGYFKITEVTRRKMLGWGSKKDFRLNMRKPFDHDQGLKEYERLLLQGLFTDRTEVHMTDLTGTFHDNVAKIKSALYTTVTRSGYFVANPHQRRTAFLIAGFVIIAAGFFLIAFNVYTVPLLGALFLFAARAMPKRTEVGVAAFRHIQGFKEYLSRAEKYRLQWQEDQHIFEKLLPYAMVLGVADKWSKAFADIAQQPPDWYSSRSRSFNALVLWSGLESMSSVTAHSFAPPAASGSSGFSGGSSGGGFGGGGGGSW